MGRNVLAVIAAAGAVASMTAASFAPATATPQAAPKVVAPQTVAPKAVTAAAKAAEIGVRTVRYAEHDANVMDVYTPAAAVGKTNRQLPTVVLIHGGGWVKGDKKDFASAAKQFAERGYVAISMNYRYATDARWPAQRTDTLDLLDYLDHHEGPLNVDDHKIVLIGSSAGAHIAASTAMYGDGKKLVEGVIGLSGPLDPARTARDTAYNLSKTVINSLMRCTPSDCPVRYDSANAINRISKKDPPSLMFASKDEWLDPQHSVKFVEKAKDEGLASTMVWMSGKEHARDYWDRAWPKIRDWVDDRLT